MIDKPKVGMKVKRSGVWADDTLPARIHRKGANVGTITGFETEDCGATTADPMVFVKFGNKKPDGFWREELVEHAG